MSIGFWQIAIVAVLIVLLMGDVAKGIKSFKKGMASDPTEDNSNKNITNNQDSNNQDSDKKE